MALQDFTTWTNSGTMTISDGAASNSSVSWTTGNQVLLYKSGTFGTSFTHKFTCNFVNLGGGAGDQNPSFWWLDTDTGNNKDSGTFLSHWTGGGNDSWFIQNQTSGGYYASCTTAGAAGTNIYVTITRSGRAYSIYFYSDSSRTTLTNSIAFDNANVSATETYSYSKITNRTNNDSWKFSGGTITDLDFDPAVVVNDTVTPDAITATAAVVAPTVSTVTNDTITPDVVPASVTANASTIDIVFRAVFPRA